MEAGSLLVAQMLEGPSSFFSKPNFVQRKTHFDCSCRALYFADIVVFNLEKLKSVQDICKFGWTKGFVGSLHPPTPPGVVFLESSITGSGLVLQQGEPRAGRDPHERRKDAAARGAECPQAVK